MMMDGWMDDNCDHVDKHTHLNQRLEVAVVILYSLNVYFTSVFCLVV